MIMRPGTVVLLACLMLLLAGSVFLQIQMYPSHTVFASWPPETECLNINQASVRELATLPGIGPVLARRIIAYRTQNQGFRKLDELHAVKGLGHKKLARLQSRVCLE